MTDRIDRIISGADRLENEPHSMPVGGDDEYGLCIYTICRDCADWKKSSNSVFGQCKKKQETTKYSDTCEDWSEK